MGRIESMISYFNNWDGPRVFVRITFGSNLVELIYTTGQTITSGQGSSMDDAIDNLIFNLRRVGFI